MRRLGFLTFLLAVGMRAQDGAKLFAVNCALCHGPKGTGGRGAELARPRLTRATTDAALFQIIHDGIPGTEMPANRAMTDREMWQVVAFVRTLGRTANEKVEGDPVSGAGVFRAAGCMGCHAIGAEGGRMGPSLTQVGERRGASYLRAVLLDPAKNLPDGFTLAEITTAAGEHSTGIVLNEDTYSIQIRDLTGELHSYWKRDLTALEERADRTPMPSVRGRLSDRELNDLLAYLVSLRSAQ